jgi:hypothetical protein
VKLTAPAGDLARALALVALGRKHNGRVATDVRRIPCISAFPIADGELALASTFHLQLAVAARAMATTSAAPGLRPTWAAPIIDLICSLPPGAPVSITATQTTVAISSQGGRRRRPPSFCGKAMPELPSMIDADDATGCIEISGADALVLLEPLPAAARALHWATVGHRLVSCAADGSKAIATSIAADGFTGGRDLIVPREGAAILGRLLKATAPEMVTLQRSKRLVAVTAPRFSFAAKLLDTEDLIRPTMPPPSDNFATCKRALLIGAIETLDAIASMTDDAPLLVLHFGAERQLCIGLAREPRNIIDVVYAETAGTGRAVVRLRFLLELLGELSGETVRLEFTDGRALRITDGDKLALLAPAN